MWLRRDLRLTDNVALFEAARRSERVVCAFVLDPALLRGPRVGAPIVQHFFDALGWLRERLRALGSDLALLEGDPATELLRFAERAGAHALFHNVDYEPDAIDRDQRVAQRFRAAALDVRTWTDHVYFGAADVLKDGGSPYVVYTPYRRRWLARFEEDPQRPVPSEEAARGKLLPRLAIGETRAVPRPECYGHRSSPAYPRAGAGEALRALSAFLAERAKDYRENRNLPALDGTSRLSPHLRAGTIGIRTVVHAAHEAGSAAPDAAGGIGAWLGELVWRDFYQQILFHHPRVATAPFLDAASTIAYRDDPAAFAAWCEGRTGYPIVDAAMAQLNATGWMHNRLRMIVASFLTKHLLIDYRAGERYFDQRLADADLAANDGGWQWSASTGTDAAPYFRVFNPVLQGRTFDPEGRFVRAMLPALRRVPTRYVHQPWTMPPLLQAESGCLVGETYPEPIVDHAFARQRAIEVYGRALGGAANRRVSSP